jgi:hypothetical protein
VHLSLGVEFQNSYFEKLGFLINPSSRCLGSYIIEAGTGHLGITLSGKYKTFL